MERREVPTCGFSTAVKRSSNTGENTSIQLRFIKLIAVFPQAPDEHPEEGLEHGQRELQQQHVLVVVRIPGVQQVREDGSQHVVLKLHPRGKECGRVTSTEHHFSSSSVATNKDVVTYDLLVMICSEIKNVFHNWFSYRVPG